MNGAVKPTTSFVVEVNECQVFATTSGAGWWIKFREVHDRTGRIADRVISLGGNLCHVACDDKDHATWLAGVMVTDHGLPGSSVRVRRVVGGVS